MDNRKLANPKRQCVMALRQREGRILDTVVPREQRAPAWDLVRRHVRGPAHLVADEAPGYDDLVALFPLTRNNHGHAYVVAPGSSTNQAESFFSRARRSFHGVHHRAASTYLDWYVADLAHREDMRRLPMKELTGRYLGAALAHPPSRKIAGYWQGNKPARTLGWMPPRQDGGRPPHPTRRGPGPIRRRLQDAENDSIAPRKSCRAVADAVRAAKRRLREQGEPWRATSCRRTSPSRSTRQWVPLPRWIFAIDQTFDVRLKLEKASAAKPKRAKAAWPVWMAVRGWSASRRTSSTALVKAPRSRVGGSRS